jgi:hypothetical protein
MKLKTGRNRKVETTAERGTSLYNIRSIEINVDEMGKVWSKHWTDEMYSKRCGLKSKIL